MDFTISELKVLSAAAVAGNVNWEEFNTLCNTLNINKNARSRALSSLREKGMLNEYALRADGDYVVVGVMVDAENGVIAPSKDSSMITVNTHPLNA